MNSLKTILVNILFLHCFTVSALTVQNLNIEWFGRGGVFSGSIEDEYRMKHLREFLEVDSSSVDVYVFQEITAPSLLHEVVGEAYTCTSYVAEVLPHQYVVLCVKSEKFISAKSDYSLQIGSKRLRAAHSVLVREDNIDYRIVGVHLKASGSHTDTRLEQVANLAKGDLLRDQRVVLIGDFNTFPKEITTREFSDLEYMEKILSPLGLIQTKEFSNTYLGRRPLTLDRVWTKGIEVKVLDLIGPCQQSKKRSKRFESRDYYERFISDHCSIKLKVGI